MKKITLYIILLLAGVGIGWILWAPVDYYEYNAESAETCLEGEQYDNANNVCYFDFYCEDEYQCALVDQRYGDVLNDLASEYISKKNNEDVSTDEPEQEPTEVVVEPSIAAEEKIEYQKDTPKKAEVKIEVHVDKASTQTSSAVDTNTAATSQISLGTYDTVEDIFYALVPKKTQNYITKIIIDSDGRDGTLAYVEPQDKIGSQWLLAYDDVDTYKKNGGYRDIHEFLTTLIHEYAHVITLNNSQVTHSQAGYINCPSKEIIVDEGCAHEDAYITHFSKRFWTEQDRDEAYYATEDDPEGYAEDLFNERPNDFVTEYAATNEGEDIAESFALFVMQSKPEGNNIKDQKIEFFYQYPELINIRNHMRGGTALVLENIKK